MAGELCGPGCGYCGACDGQWEDTDAPIQITNDGRDDFGWPLEMAAPDACAYCGHIGCAGCPQKEAALSAWLDSMDYDAVNDLDIPTSIEREAA